ncbi:imelysin family protein [Cerasicoccus maritimus]|uniref:imelysin family protein n=1 Tax=Cerasicoccus maritimus TaxID=490089 RepID=UPI002852AEF6|nr:imelysin family protein [Cerasicoccus maritimus]
MACNACLGLAEPSDSRVLAVIATNGVKPMLQLCDEDASQLHDSIARLCEQATDSNLLKARDDWKRAYLSWKNSAACRFGAINTIDKRINRWAVNGVVLDAAVESDDLDHLLAQAEQRGFAALEYLLFTPKNAHAATTIGRRKHMLAISMEIAECAHDAWLVWNDGYGAEFIAAGNGDPFLTTSDALSIAYVRLLNVTERLLLDQIGLPSAFFAEETRPQNLHAWLSGCTLAGMQAEVEGLLRVLSGDGSDSLLNLIATQDGLVEKRDPALAAAIRGQLAKIQRTLGKLQQSSTPIQQQLEKNPEALKELYEQLNTLQEQLIEGSLVLELDVYTGKQPTFASEGNP